jgi:hypothetical protein
VTLAPPSPVQSVLFSMTLEEKLQLLHSLRRGEPFALPVVEGTSYSSSTAKAARELEP